MTSYPTNVSDSQWQILSKYFDIQRSRKYDLREIVNAILYWVKTGCQWRMLPKDFAPWKLVYYYFNTWKKNGIFEILQQDLVEKCRETIGKKAEPTVGIIDAQSVKNTLVSAENKGFDAGKKVKGIKRHIIVDTLGLILAVVIQNASVQDRDGAVDVISSLGENWKKIIKVFADGGYRGKLIETVKTQFKIVIEIIKRDELHAFKILPKRWIVERTFAWIDTNRRTSKNYERKNDTAVAVVQLAAIRIMIKRF
jgi:putative transposase